MALTMASPRRRRTSPRTPRQPSRRDSGRGARSRSRSGGRRPQRRESQRSHRTDADGEDASREVKEAVKSARDKAKEQMEKEREKARLKKAERDSATKEREQQRKDAREQKREEAAMALTQSVNDNAGRRPRDGGDSLKIAAQSEAEQKAEAATAAAVAAAARGIEQKRSRKPQATPPPAVEEAQIRKLFELLDGKNKGEVSQRDVLVALKKHHPIRQLFGLVGSGEAAALQQRVERIQEAFESGSGLGEVAPIFNSLKEASGTNGSFHFAAFRSACQRQLQCNVVAAVESLPREHAQGEAFTPSKHWSVVPPGAACPAGLEYRMDMETGQTLARLPKS